MCASNSAALEREPRVNNDEDYGVDLPAPRVQSDFPRRTLLAAKRPEAQAEPDPRNEGDRAPGRIPFSSRAVRDEQQSWSPQESKNGLLNPRGQHRRGISVEVIRGPGSAVTS